MTGHGRSPSWNASSTLIPLLDSGSGGLLLLAPLNEQSGEPAGGPPAAVSLLGDPDGTGATAGALWDAVGDRLCRGRPLVPALAVPTDVREAQLQGTPGADAVEPDETVESDLSDIETDVTTIELADLPKIGMAPLPSFPGYAGAPVLGGWLLAISQHSPRREAASELIRFLTSPEARRRIAIGIGYNPTRRALYSEKPLLEIRPVLKDLYPIFLAARPRPVTPYYLLLSQSAQPEVSAFVVGRKTASETLQSVRRQAGKTVVAEPPPFDEATPVTPPRITGTKGPTGLLQLSERGWGYLLAAPAFVLVGLLAPPQES